jgi:hypothetical protein
MAGHVSDEVLNLFAVVGTHDEISDKLCQRFADVVTSCEFSIAVRGAADRQQLARIAARARTPSRCRAPTPCSRRARERHHETP